jgi:O-antigen ligase
VRVVAAGLSALLGGGDLGDDGVGVVGVAGAVGVAAATAWPWIRARGGGRTAWLAVVCVVGVAGVAGANVAERVGGCAYAGLTHGRTGIWKAAWRTARDRPVLGHGLESFAVASRAEQLRERDVPVQYAHDLPLEAWVELGVVGVALVLALYAAVALEVLRVGRVPAALLGPGALAFLVANLFDWPWHLAGSGVLWAIAVGALIASRPDAIHKSR